MLSRLKRSLMIGLTQMNYCFECFSQDACRPVESLPGSVFMEPDQMLQISGNNVGWALMVAIGINIAISGGFLILIWLLPCYPPPHSLSSIFNPRYQVRLDSLLQRLEAIFPKRSESLHSSPKTQGRSLSYANNAENGNDATGSSAEAEFPSLSNIYKCYNVALNFGDSEVAARVRQEDVDKDEWFIVKAIHFDRSCISIRWKQYVIIELSVVCKPIVTKKVYIAQMSKGRSGKLCTERWFNQLRLDIKKDFWTMEYQILMVAHAEVETNDQGPKGFEGEGALTLTLSSSSSSWSGKGELTEEM
ncbi:transcription factor MYB98-like protein [Tanacetum coccineum]